MDCKCCGNWFGSASDSEICSICERAIQRVGKYLSTIDPIRAAGGCRCGECKRWQRFGEPLPDGMPADWGTCTRLLDPDSECEITTADGDFCSYGEPREAQDDE